jgi:His/Glu/Gln/Arg/opine family amino acid ABC transporter permease subunit
MRHGTYFPILKGFGNTLILTCCSAILGLMVGTLLAFVRIRHRFSGKWSLANKGVVCFVQLFRGTPVMLQLLILLDLFASWELSLWTIAILGFGLNSGAYVSEILRASVGEVDTNHQFESALALGFSDYQALKLVVLPQALKNSVPALLNEFCSLLKETAVVGVIVLTCLAQAAEALYSVTYKSWPFFIAGLLYLVVIIFVSCLLTKLIRRTSLATTK